MKLRATKTAGFTLVEVVIAILLFVLLIGGIVKLYTTYSTLYRVQKSQMDVTHSASTLENEVHAAVLQADAIIASHTFSGTSYTSGSTTVILELPSITSAGDTIASTYDYIVFYASTTNAYEVISLGTGSVRPGGTRHLSSSISNLTFTYNNASPALATSTDASVTTRGTVKNQTITTTVHQKTYLRNSSL
jgi:Tfp pilus assembly protein PilV